MMFMAWFLRALCTAAFAFSSLAVSSAEQNLWVHSHLLTTPKATTLKGDYAHFGFSGESLALGGVVLPFPVELPKNRGNILHHPLPSYSHRGGLSEWGKGWSSSLSIQRYAEVGEVECTGGSFSSPWGKLQVSLEGKVYYPKGLELDLRVSKSTSGFIVYHPDGRVFRFEKAYGDFAWYLVDVRDREGHATVFEYEENPSGRPFLKIVRYGGKKRFQYEIEIEYETIGNPVRAYESCQLETTLDRRVSVIVFKHWNGQKFQTSKKFYLRHENVDNGATFYLSRVETEFASGDRPPAVTYHYDGYGRFLERPYQIVANNFTDLVSRLKFDQFYAASVTFVDFNQDGLVDIEVAQNLMSFLQTKDGQFVPHVNYVTAVRDELCPPSGDYYSNFRRLLIRPAGLQDQLQQLVVRNDSGPEGARTRVVVCSLEGKVRFEKDLQIRGEQGSFKDATHLADLNSDLKPDLVRLIEGQYTYYLNQSTKDEIKFSDAITKSFQRVGSKKIKEYQFVDINGDRLLDIVGKADSGIYVWHGRGQMDFGPEVIFYSFQADRIPALAIAKFDLSFVDINRDGLMDAILDGHLLINRGDRFHLVSAKSLEERPRGSKVPHSINLSGTPDDQLSMMHYSLGLVVYNLNGPSTGLLTQVDNGQGIVLDFEYQWTDFKPGVPRPFIVPKSLTVSTAGKGTQKTEYEFIDPRVDLATGQLIGFAQVKTRDSQVSVQTDFMTSAEHSPKPIEIRKQDERVKGLFEVETHEWKSDFLDGIHYPKLIKTIQAYLSKGEPIVRRSIDFLAHDRLCANQTRENASLGLLERLVSYVDSRACLKANETLVGPDFTYTTLTTYNQAGLPTNLELATATERLQKIALGYDDKLVLKNVTQPGKGTIFLHYDAVFEVLKSLQFPDGTWRNMTAYSPEADAVSGLLSKGGSTELLTQNFVYDEFQRLKQASTNLGQQSEYSYRLPTQTCPGVLSEILTKTAMLTSADGELLTQGTQSQTGWYFGPLYRKVLARNKEQQIDLGSLSLNPTQLTFQDLESANAVLSETESSELFGILSRDSAVTSSHRNHMTHRFEVDAAGFKASSEENDQYVTSNVLDLSTSQPIAYTDELSQTYIYERDVLGRLRKITLPDGNIHTIDFDMFGRVSNITRSNIAGAVYGYDNANDRLSEKTVLGVRETYAYDAAGRVKTMLRGLERYEFSYEGNAVAQVDHAEFMKKSSYTPDDKPELSSLTTKSGLSIALEFGYDNFRRLIEQNVSNIYTKQFVYDDYRQLGLVRIGNQTFSISRNNQGKVSKIDLPHNQTFHVDYDSLTQGRIGHSSHQGSYSWSLNDRGLIDHAQFTSSADTCDPKMLSFVYAADKTLQEAPFNLKQSNSLSAPGRGLYDENRHRIGKYSGSNLEHIRFNGIVATAEHIYEKFAVEGIDLGILIDGQFQPCLFDQVGSILAIGDVVSIPSAFGERKEYQPIFEYFDYAGQGRDPETGFIAMGERDYDPKTHQFTSADRFFLESPEECVRSPQECDLLSYAKNNPLIYTDEDGLNARLVQGLGAVGFGVATNYPAVKRAATELYQEPSLKNAGILTAEVLLPATRLGRAVLKNVHNTDAEAKEWAITNPEKVLFHPKFKIIMKDPNSPKNEPRWWSKDTAGHGGSTWKVFKETNKGLQWETDATRFGDFIDDKHKSDVGKFIPWKELRNVK
ncbi:MAG: RHS repeat-associated core domain-containing protein [Myxococcota bacterium]